MRRKKGFASFLKVIFAILIGLLVLLLIGKFILEYLHKKTIDKELAAYSPFISVSYKKLKIGFDGSLSMSGIRIRPTMFPTSLNIDEIKMFSSDRNFLLVGMKVFGKNKYPDTFSFKVKNWQLDPGFWHELNSKSACRYFDGSLDFDDFGMDSMSGDYEVAMDFSDKNNSVIEIGLDIYDQYDMNIELLMDVTQLKANIVRANQLELPFKEITITTQLDQGFATEFTEYCANKMKIKVSEYLQGVIGSDQYMKGLGLRLTESAKNALRDYHKGDVLVEVVSRPSQLIRSFDKLKFYNPVDAANLMNLTASIDGKNIGDIYKTDKIDEEGYALELENAEQKELDDENDKAIKADQAQKEKVMRQIDERIQAKIDEEAADKQQASYHVIKRSQLANYIGSYIRVERAEKPTISGFLLARSKSKIEIERKGYGGYMVYPVRLSEVTKIEVYK